MRSIYNLLFLICFALSSPFYFLKMWRRGGWRSQFGERFARYGTKLKTALTNRHTIWLHAVSVGEVNLATHLIRYLEPRVPTLTMVVSTTTSTGMAQLKERLPAHVNKIYYPIDRRKFVQKAYSVIRPKAVILVEAEIWPNFLWQGMRRNCPVFLVNARLSDRSYRGYRLFKFLFGPLFASFEGISCPSEQDARRLVALGARKDAVHVVGNLKFDAATLSEKSAVDVPDLLQLGGKQPGAKVLVAASTHAGEEKVMAEIFLRLKTRFKDIYLLIAPRHAERGKEVGEELKAAGLKFVYRTELRPGNSIEADCMLLNTTGELRFFYQYADLIFVGKSITAEGGQNPLEPASYGRTVVFGPNMQNFEAISKAMLADDAAVQVKDAHHLEEVLGELLSNDERREELGRNGLAVLRKNVGALERTVEMILEHLREKKIVPVRG